MKKLITVAILLVSLSATAQFAQTGWNNLGPDFYAGVTVEKVTLSVGYNFHLSRIDKPKILSLNAGYDFILDNKEENNYVLTATAGMAQIKKKDFPEYHDGYGVPNNKLTGAYCLELGKDSYMGRFVLNAKYCDGFYFGGALRFYLSRN